MNSNKPAAPAIVANPIVDPIVAQQELAGKLRRRGGRGSLTADALSRTRDKGKGTTPLSTSGGGYTAPSTSAPSIADRKFGNVRERD